MSQKISFLSVLNTVVVLVVTNHVSLSIGRRNTHNAVITRVDAVFFMNQESSFYLLVKITSCFLTFDAILFKARIALVVIFID